MKNPANKILLWLFLLPSAVYRKMGVDIPQLKAILLTKLTIDDRKATGLYKTRYREREGDINMATAITMFISFLMGCVMLVSFFIQDDLTRLTIYFSILAFMLAMFLITDFSSILIDPADNYIILPKPIAPVTFISARLIHILIHLTKILVPLSIPGLIAMAISRGLSGVLILIPCIIMLTLMVFVLVNFVYLFIIRIFSAEKLNSIISALQIGFAILLYSAYFSLNYLIDLDEDTIFSLIDSPTLWIFPSYWLADTWIFFYTMIPDPSSIVSVILSITIPLLSLWVVIKYLAPAFFRKLSLVNSSVSEHESSKLNVQPNLSKNTISSFMAKIFTRPGIEREAFLFTWRMSSRYREFKMKVYPQIGYLFVLFVFMVIRSWDKFNFDDTQENLGQNKLSILTAVYLSCFVFTGAIMQLGYFEKFKAGWIYFCSPILSPGLIIRGAIKACFIKFFLPAGVLVTFIGIYLFGLSIIPNLLFGFGNIFLICAIYSWVIMSRLPFSISPKESVEGQNTFRMTFMLIALPIVAIPHYFLFDKNILMSIIYVFSIAISIIVINFMKNISWSYIDPVDVT